MQIGQIAPSPSVVMMQLQIRPNLFTPEIPTPNSSKKNATTASLPTLPKPASVNVTPNLLTNQRAVTSAIPTIDSAISLQTPSAQLSSTPPVDTPVSTQSGSTAVTPLVQTVNTVQLPSSNADYLDNPVADFPPISQRLGEQGTVLVHVLISKEGKALQASVAQTSGFARLDQAGLKAAMRWRYVPGKLHGQAQDMWFDVPVNFKLK